MPDTDRHPTSSSTLPHTVTSNVALALGAYATVISWATAVFPLAPGADFFGSTWWLLISFVSAFSLFMGFVLSGSRPTLGITLTVAGALLRIGPGIAFGFNGALGTMLLDLVPAVLGLGSAGLFLTAWVRATPRVAVQGPTTGTGQLSPRLS